MEVHRVLGPAERGEKEGSWTTFEIHALRVTDARSGLVRRSRFQEAVEVGHRNGEAKTKRRPMNPEN
jgi:hypothetical protein